jgi:hypothetical protein
MADLTLPQQCEAASKEAPTTGWPPSELMQDDCRKLSKWFASKPDARQRAREAAAAIKADSSSASGLDRTKGAM